MECGLPRNVSSDRNCRDKADSYLTRSASESAICSAQLPLSYLDERYVEVDVLVGRRLSHVHHARNDARRRAVDVVVASVQLDVLQQRYLHTVLQHRARTHVSVECPPCHQ